MFMKEPHTALFVAPTGVGKTHLALNLLVSEYKNSQVRYGKGPVLKIEQNL